MAILITDGVGKGDLGMVTTFCSHNQVKMESLEVLATLHQCNSPEPSVFIVWRYTNTPFIPWGISRLLYLNGSDLPGGTSSSQFPLNCLCLQNLLPYSKTKVLLPHGEGEMGYRRYPFSQEVLWKCSEELCCLSNPVSLSMPSLAPPPHLEEGIHMEGKLGYNPALQYLQDFNQAIAQLKSEQSEELRSWIINIMLSKSKWREDVSRNGQEWSIKGDYTFQEMFSMTSLADSVKLLPWCISTGIPLCHMDDALVATEWQGKTALATAGATEPEEPSALGLSSSPAHSSKTPPHAIPVLLDLPFEGTPSMGHPFFESLAGPLQKKGDHSPSGLLSDQHSKRTQVHSPKVEVRSEHSFTWVMTTCMN